MQKYRWIMAVVAALAMGSAAPIMAACNGTETLKFKRGCSTDKMTLVLRNGTPRTLYVVCLQNIDDFRVIGCRSGMANDRGKYRAKWDASDGLYAGCYVGFIEYCSNSPRSECCTD